MFGSFIIEMMVGLLATFASLGLCVTTLTEVIETYVKLIRTEYLQLYLRQLFTLSASAVPEGSFFKRLVKHPLLTYVIRLTGPLPASTKS